MARVKRGFKGRTRRKRILERAKGFRGSRNSRIRSAIHVVKRALVYAYRDRKVRKREFRALWITRINAACRQAGLKYSEFINGLKRSGIEIDRSVLSDLATNDRPAFDNLVAEAKTALGR